MKRFVLAGNPNCGKTTLFNSLTGSSAHVGNWPGVTVDKRDGIYKGCEEHISVIDLPGIYSLSPYTPEEVISRNYILDENPDCLIDIVDVTNLERNLYLTTQLLEMDVPMVVALNMIDVLDRHKERIDAKMLEEALGVPVVKVSALHQSGLDELMEKAFEESKKPRKGKSVLEGSDIRHLIGDVRIALKGQNVKSPLFHAIKLIENDELEVKMHAETVEMVKEYTSMHDDPVFGNDFESLIADGRYKYISKHFSPALTKTSGDGSSTASEKADRIITHRVWSIPIFLLVMFLMFHLTFGNDLLYIGAVFRLPSLKSVGLKNAEGIAVNGWAALLGTIYDAGVKSPGIFLSGVIGLLTDILTEAVRGALQSSPAWVAGLICDGVLGGLFAILGFLPQILVLFLMFSILEDSGYMARIAFIFDRAFRKMGLSGKALMPMIMGFGCSVPAMINTRALNDDSEKLAAIRVIPFFSCSAKLPMLTGVAGAVVVSFGVGNADLITYGMYLLGVLTAVLALVFMKSTTLKNAKQPFIMELPAYHMPQFKNLMIHVWDKAKHFIQKAFTVILASTIIIWFFTNFSWNWQMVGEEDAGYSVLASLGKFIQPLCTPLGFGVQLNEWGWVFVVAAITGLVAKENVIATLGTLAGSIPVAGAAVTAAAKGAAEVSVMIAGTGITVPALLAFVAFNLTTVPCVAAVATARAELPSGSRFIRTVLFWVISSYIVASAVYTIGTWWWTSFIWVAAFTAAIIILRLFGRKNSETKEKIDATN